MWGLSPEKRSAVLVLGGFLSGCTLLGTPAVAGPDPLQQALDLHRAGKLTEALAAYEQVMEEGSDARQDGLARLALAYHNACIVLINLADPATALDQCRRALELRRGLGDERGVARTLANLGLALRYLGRYDEAESAYRESLAINEQRADVPAQVRNLSNLGVLAMTAGRYGESMRLHTAAESLAERHADEPWSEGQLRIARLNQGAVLEKLGAFREALDLLRALAVQVGDEDSGLHALVQVNLGVIYRNLGDPIRAVESFRKAAATYARLGDEAGLSNAKLNLALALHLNLRRLDEAEVAYREALDLAREGSDRAEEIQDLFYHGNLQLEIGNVGEAERSFRRCLELAEASRSAEGRWSGLYGLGRVAEARDDPGAALELFRQAMAEIEMVRANLADPSLRSGYFGDKRPIYGAAVKVLARMHRQEPAAGHDVEAFEIAERAKARDLLDALGAASPAAPLGAEALRGLLDRQEVVLEYFRGGDNLCLWVVRRQGIRIVELGPARPIFDRAAQVHDALAAGDEPPRETVAWLSRALLGDAFPADARIVRIAPDGNLFHLPFEILAEPGSPGGILLDRMVVSYLPSASTLALLARRQDEESATRDLRLAGFANPDLPHDRAAPQAPASLLVSRYGLGPLPAAEQEMAAVGRSLSGRQEVRLGSAATEATFREIAARGSQVLHLATHTVVDERPGQSPVILLAAGEGQDGLLYPEEIAGLDYRVRLTVLASCHSALSDTEGGRALASLTGSFLAAGSDGVVATLWEVDDAATAMFMGQFYHQLSRGLDAAEALRRAKLRFRANPSWNRSGLWSAYVLVGEGVRVVEPPRIPLWSWALAALLFAAALVVGWRRSRDAAVS